MTIQFLPQNSKTIAVLVGDLTLETMDSFLPSFADLSVRGEYDVELDMTGVPLLDTVGAGLLLALQDRLAGQGLEMHLSCPQPGPLLLLQQIGLAETMTIIMGRDETATVH